MGRSWRTIDQWFYPLTPREAEVLELLAEGLSNDEIARTMQLNRLNIDKVVSTSRSKLNLSTRKELAEWVAKYRPAGSRPNSSEWISQVKASSLAYSRSADRTPGRTSFSMGRLVLLRLPLGLFTWTRRWPLRRMREPSRPWFYPLSPRQARVLELLAEGLSIDEISRTMSLNPTLIEYFLSTTKQQLDLHTNSELVDWVAKQRPRVAARD
jgi:DNA-binding NarL/FixJ family response regulator